MKIVNKRKFIRSISTIGVIIFIMLIFANISLSHTETKFKMMSVVSGDTLWSIARLEKSNNEYFKDKEIRDIVDEIKYINNLSDSSLKVGEQLTIPTI